MLKKFNTIDPDILRCPCEKKATIAVECGSVKCTGANCQNNIGFLQSNNQPVFINFEFPLVIFEKGDFETADDDTTGVIPRRRLRGVSSLFKSAITVRKPTENNVRVFLDSLPDKPKVLIIGGGTRGNGTEELWEKVDVEIISVDVYASANTSFVTDAHYLPFADETFDGVFIQSVLEHVVDPSSVVEEIYRVLKWNGVVYSETPFMQQVHEGAFDFTRYTLSGHRFLFRKFQELSTGTIKGPAVALAWSLRYAVRPFVGKKLSTALFGIIMLVLKFIDRLYKGSRSIDGASETFFLGKKIKGFRYQVRELRSFYAGMQ